MGHEAVSQFEKLLKQLRSNPQAVSYEELKAFAGRLGFQVANQRGSHVTFIRSGSYPIVIVKPHGPDGQLRPADVRRLLAVCDKLGLVPPEEEEP